MVDTTRTLLRRLLVERYKALETRLTAKLGSSALAGEALHETYLRLGQGGDLEPVRNAEAYVYRAALHTAFNLRNADARWRKTTPIDEMPEIADETPGPDRIASGRIQVEIVMRALAELPQRQREAFLEGFIGATPAEELAARYGVGIRTIQADVRAAVVHLARRLGRKEILAAGRARLSKK